MCLTGAKSIANRRRKKVESVKGMVIEIQVEAKEVGISLNDVIKLSYRRGLLAIGHTELNFHKACPHLSQLL